MISAHYTFEGRDGPIRVEVTVQTAGPLFDRMVRHLTKRALDSKKGLATIAGGLIKVVIQR